MKKMTAGEVTELHFISSLPALSLRWGAVGAKGKKNEQSINFIKEEQTWSSRLTDFSTGSVRIDGPKRRALRDSRGWYTFPLLLDLG